MAIVTQVEQKQALNGDQAQQLAMYLRITTPLTRYGHSLKVTDVQGSSCKSSPRLSAILEPLTPYAVVLRLSLLPTSLHHSIAVIEITAG